MREFRIAVIVGSLRRQSFNRRLAQVLIDLAPDHFSCREIQINDLPLYNQDDDESQEASVIRLKHQISEADGLIFVTPEYNRSVPGVLKNAIDHASRPYGDNSWAGKPAGIIGASIGNIGTALAQQHLRGILACLDVRTMTQPEAYIHIDRDYFTPNGALQETNLAYLRRWMDALVAWIEATFNF